MSNSMLAGADAGQSKTEGPLAKWLHCLSAPIDGASLAVFRMWLGVCLVFNVWIYTDSINTYYLVPKFNFSFVPGLHAWPGSGMLLHFAVMALTSACIGLGFFYRPATIVFFAAQLYTFLLDKSYYQNHFYLICLLGFLFCFIPANRVWSLDASNKRWPPFVPRWTIVILRAQLVLVYFYAGVAKLCSDWMRGEPQTTFLKQYPTDTIFGTMFAQPWFAHLMTYGGLAFDLLIGFLLLWRPTFWFAAIAAIAFHFLNSRLFEIGIFPWLMMGTVGLFAPPDWPRRVLKMFGLVRKQPSDTEQAASSSIEETPVLNAPTFKWNSPGNIALLALLHIYFLLQILIPLRHFLYPGDVNWTEQGHRFSWQMMLRIKTPIVFEMVMKDPRNGANIPFDATKILNEKQCAQMQTRPDMILQFAHFLADSYQRKTGVRPIINARALESLNMNPPQELIDPSVDLASQSDSVFGASWILPYDRSKDRK